MTGPELHTGAAAVDAPVASRTGRLFLKTLVPSTVCGLLGVVLGFGLFLYLDANLSGQDSHAYWVLAAGLGTAAVLAYVFDQIREEISGVSSAWHISAGIFATIFMVEAFIVTGHELVNALVEPESKLVPSAERVIGPGDEVLIHADAMLPIVGSDIDALLPDFEARVAALPYKEDPPSMLGSVLANGLFNFRNPSKLPAPSLPTSVLPPSWTTQALIPGVGLKLAPETEPKPPAPETYPKPPELLPLISSLPGQHVLDATRVSPIIPDESPSIKLAAAVVGRIAELVGSSSEMMDLAGRREWALAMLEGLPNTCRTKARDEWKDPSKATNSQGYIPALTFGSLSCEPKDGSWPRIVAAYAKPTELRWLATLLEDVLTRGKLFDDKLRDLAKAACRLTDGEPHAAARGHSKAFRHGEGAAPCERALAELTDLQRNKDSFGRLRRAAINRDLIALAFPQIGDAPHGIGQRAVMAFFLMLGLYVLLAIGLNMLLGWFVAAPDGPKSDTISSLSRAAVISGTLVGATLAAILLFRSGSFLAYLVAQTPPSCRLNGTSFFGGSSLDDPTSWISFAQSMAANAVPHLTIYLKTNYSIPSWVTVPAIICASCVAVLAAMARDSGPVAFWCGLPLIGILIAPAVPSFDASLFLFLTAAITWVPIALLFSFSLPHLRPFAFMPQQWAPAALAMGLALAALTAFRGSAWSAAEGGHEDVWIWGLGAFSTLGLWTSMRAGRPLRDAYIWLGLGVCFVLALTLAGLKYFGTFLDAVNALQSTLDMRQNFLASCGLTSPVTPQPMDPARHDAYWLEIALVSCIGFFTTLSVLAAWAQREAPERGH